ncbi:unnamed protein product [Polarella glacialis]|uniref:FYVE-type domain-containing protein n=1 Tax=Polarella glacialis TaxID=89957 RepID=A0A813DT51_POLGL|nr:unnamed protein product [Polarella glacialis]
MWDDAGTGSRFARLNLLHWSKARSVIEIAAELGDLQGQRAVRVYAKGAPQGVEEERELVFASPAEASSVLRCNSYDCSTDEFDVFDAIGDFRLRQADVHQSEAVFSWPPSVPQELCRQCIECGAPATDHCEVCGLALCSQPRFPVPRCISIQPLLAGTNAPERLRTCRRCVSYAESRALARTVLRSAKATAFRAAVAGEPPVRRRLFVRSLEEADDCAACGRVFLHLVGSQRHRCRGCRRALCAVCFCGNFTCMGTGMCPHKIALPHDGFLLQEKVCKDCLPVARIRLVARDAVKSIHSTGIKYAEHGLRVRTYLEDPPGFPMYVQDYVDTAAMKAVRAANLAVGGARMLTPLLSLPYALGVQAAHAAWNYGQYGLLGIFFSSEISEGIQTLSTMSSAIEAIEPREMLIGMLYLSAHQRHTFGTSPDGAHEEAMAAGQAQGCQKHLLTTNKQHCN